MATLYKASFKTAYLQREIVVDMPLANSGRAASADGLVPANAYKIGDVLYNNSGTLTGKSSAPAVGDFIIAQSDMTMGYGHVPVENRDYRYSDAVTASPSAPKKLALFKITNVDDIIPVAQTI